MASLREISVRGYKSIKDQTIALGPMNVLIGANGAGKSNFVSFFKLLNEMMGRRLQEFIGASGGAQSILHYGPKRTPFLEAVLRFDTDDAKDTFCMRLSHAAVDTLIFTEERLEFLKPGYPNPKVEHLGAGHKETEVLRAAEEEQQIARVFRAMLNRCRVFQFHDTSATAPIRQPCYIEHHRWLMPDGGNLAAVLHRLCNAHPNAYRRIVGTIRQIAPFFDDFCLEPSEIDGKRITLNWREVGSDRLFGPHQLSDGTLRAMALVTLLRQPIRDLPDVIVIDEPELGLHPFAKNILASAMKKASHDCQVILATQSAGLLDAFDPEDIIVVERGDAGSVFQRLNAENLEHWLEEYSVRELWEKNVLGGGPA